MNILSCGLNSFNSASDNIFKVTFIVIRCTLDDDFFADRCLCQVKSLKYQRQRHLVAKKSSSKVYNINFKETEKFKYIIMYIIVVV